jgi:molybdopterin-containing oxidoreductase family membrane subunit
MHRVDPQDKTNLIDPLFRAGPRFWLACLGLLAVVGWGAAMYLRQIIFGLGETSMNRPAYWGVYIVNFIFLIGVSMAGTLISASLHLVNAEWRRPLTRIAEALTVFGLAVAGLQILFDMGRPDRMLYVLQYGRLQSPLLWDATSLTVYILASMMALYLEVLPDLALLRDNLPEGAPAWRRLLYSRLALGWRGNRQQWQRLHRATTLLAIAIIPIGVSLHTVTSWIFSTTVQPGWKSTILGPYFVVGAIFSGLGLLFIVMTAVRRWLPAGGYIGERQYRNLGWFFIVMNIVWFYFTYTENLTLAAEQETLEFIVLASKLWGEFAAGYWAMVALMVLAFWVMVVPRILPRAGLRLPVLQPHLAPAWAAGAALLVVGLAVPERLPAQAALSGPAAYGAVIALLVVLLLLAGLSLAAWLKPRPMAASVLAGISVVVAMWLERWNIIIPTLTHPRLIAFTSYFPSLTEIALTAASVALLGLMLLVFFKLVPAVSIWEVAEGRLVAEATSKLVMGEPEANERPRRAGWAARTDG